MITSLPEQAIDYAAMSSGGGMNGGIPLAKEPVTWLVLYKGLASSYLVARPLDWE